VSGHQRRTAVLWNQPYTKLRQQYCVRLQDTFCSPLKAYFGGSFLSQIDPTDDVLATIASALDHPEPTAAPDAAIVEEQPAAPSPSEAAGYSKLGPGPMAAIRFKWTVRREDNGDYYVDETIGEHSLPIVTGPMSADAAIRLVDDREREAVQRFEQLKNQIVTKRG
jgi:hypothetical protein